jgi:O-antigen ligase
MVSAFVWIVCMALAAAPPILAATTFDRTFSPTLYLGFAVPTLIAEACVVIAALLSGMRPVAALLRLSTASQIAILVWLATLAYVNLAVAPFGYGARLFVLVMLMHGLFALALVDRLAFGWAGLQDRLLIAVGWGALTYCVVAYGLLWTVRDLSAFDWWQPGVGVSHVRQFAFYGVTCAAIGAGLAASIASSSGRVRVFTSFLFIAVGGGMCLWSGGRAAAGALLLTLALAVAISAPGTRKRAAWIIATAAVAGTGLSLGWLPHETYGLPRILNSVQPNDAGGLRQYTTGRTQIWVETLQLWAERPLMGYGMGQFKFLVPAAVSTYTHPHNAPIQFLFQWGLVGTAAVLVMARKAIVEYAATIRAPDSSAGKVAVCLLTGHGAMSMLEGNLFHTYPVSIVILALAVLGTLQNKAQSISER